MRSARPWSNVLNATGATTSDHYDGNNLTLEVVKDGLNHILSSSSFTYDQGGEQTQEVDGGVLLTTASSYDGGQMTLQVVTGVGGAVSRESFGYDDAGSLTLTNAVDGLPDGLSINASTGLISGTVSNGDALAGPYPVAVTASPVTWPDELMAKPCEIGLLAPGKTPRSVPGSLMRPVAVVRYA